MVMLNKWSLCIWVDRNLPLAVPSLDPNNTIECSCDPPSQPPIPHNCAQLQRQSRDYEVSCKLWWADWMNLKLTYLNQANTRKKHSSTWYLYLSWMSNCTDSRRVMAVIQSVMNKIMWGWALQGAAVLQTEWHVTVLGVAAAPAMGWSCSAQYRPPGDGLQTGDRTHAHNH